MSHPPTRYSYTCHGVDRVYPFIVNDSAVDPVAKTATHTPGPWENKTFGEIKAKGDAFTVAQCMMGTLGEREANANLIAAAPELLEALKAVVRALEYSYRLDPGQEVKVAPWSMPIIMARAAIAKAEGVR